MHEKDRSATGQSAYVGLYRRGARALTVLTLAAIWGCGADDAMTGITPSQVEENAAVAAGPNVIPIGWSDSCVVSGRWKSIP